MNRIILITAAGNGTRYQRAGIKTPKPLIFVEGKTLLEHTLDSFELSKDDVIIIAVQRNHLVRKKLGSKLDNELKCHKIYWVELDAILPGQLATANYAINKFKSVVNTLLDKNLWIHNCDTGFCWPDQSQQIETYGSMPVIRADGEQWSFGKPDPTNNSRAIEIAEKKRISNLASIGLYGFKTCGEFLEESTYQLKSGKLLSNEHYIAPMLQRFIENGKEINLPIVDNIRQFGTPMETCQTFKVSLGVLQSLNQ